MVVASDTDSGVGGTGVWEEQGNTHPYQRRQLPLGARITLCGAWGRFVTSAHFSREIGNAYLPMKYVCVSMCVFLMLV